MAATKLEDVVWRAQEAINKVVECDDTFEERHRALERLRAFLDARAEQTRPDSIALADLLGDWTS